MNTIISIFILIEFFACLIGVVGYLCVSVEEGSLLEALRVFIDFIKNNPCVSLIVCGFFVGTLISFVLLEIILIPFRIDTLIIKRDKDNFEEVCSFRYERCDGGIGVGWLIEVIYKKSSFKLDGFYSYEHEFEYLFSKVNYIYKNSPEHYIQMDYTLNVIFNNLKYICENHKSELRNEIVKSEKLIDKIYSKVVKMVDEESNELQDKKMKILNGYKKEMENTYNLLNEFWEKSI